MNKMKGSQLYDFPLFLLSYSFKFPTLTTSKRPGLNTLNSLVIRLSSPPLPQVSGLGRTSNSLFIRLSSPLLPQVSGLGRTPLTRWLFV